MPYIIGGVLYVLWWTFKLVIGIKLFKLWRAGDLNRVAIKRELLLIKSKFLKGINHG